MVYRHVAFVRESKHLVLESLDRFPILGRVPFVNIFDFKSINVGTRKKRKLFILIFKLFSEYFRQTDMLTG